MHHPISSPDLAILLREVDAAARRLRWRLRLPPSDQDDLRQELLLDLIQRALTYDPRRGSLGAFASVVLRNRQIQMLTGHARRLQAQGGATLPLEALDDPDPVGGGRRRPTSHATAPCAVEPALRRIAVAHAVGRLPKPDRALCAAAEQDPVDVVVARGFGSRASLYRRLRNLRCPLAAFGLRAA